MSDETRVIHFSEELFNKVCGEVQNEMQIGGLANTAYSEFAAQVVIALMWCADIDVRVGGRE